MKNLIKKLASFKAFRDFFILQVSNSRLVQAFGEDVGEKQLDLLISWERYAELIEYDDNKEIIYLEQSA